MTKAYARARYDKDGRLLEFHYEFDLRKDTDLCEPDCRISELKEYMRILEGAIAYYETGENPYFREKFNASERSSQPSDEPT